LFNYYPVPAEVERLPGLSTSSGPLIKACGAEKTPQANLANAQLLAIIKRESTEEAD